MNSKREREREREREAIKFILYKEEKEKHAIWHLFILSPTLSYIPYKWQMHFNEKVPPNCGMHDSPFSYAPPDTLAWIYLFYEEKPCAHFFKAGREAIGLL